MDVLMVRYLWMTSELSSAGTFASYLSVGSVCLLPVTETSLGYELILDFQACQARGLFHP